MMIVARRFANVVGRERAWRTIAGSAGTSGGSLRSGRSIKVSAIRSASPSGPSTS